MTKKELNEIISADRKAMQCYVYQYEWQRLLSPFKIDMEIWRFQYLITQM